MTSRLLSLLLVFGLIACADDDSDTAGGITTFDGAVGAIDADPREPDGMNAACTNTSDLAATEAMYDGKTYAEVVEQCGRDCLGDPRIDGVPMG